VHDMQAYLVTEFIEEYEDGALDRATLDRRIVGTLGPQEEARVLEGVQVQARRAPRSLLTLTLPIHGGAGLTMADIGVPLADGELRGYLVRPDDENQRPGIVAIHENRGLVEHTKDCARRLASAGYVVLAPDLLSRRGGTDTFPGTSDAIAALGQSDPHQNTRDLVTTLDWLSGQRGVDRGRLGVTGWCMGGGYTWRVATQAGDRIRAAVPWYGPNPPDGVERIAAPVFAIYGELDQRINAGIDGIAGQMKALGKPFSYKMYPGAQHAFNNDTNPERYHPAQARIAWDDMLEFFSQHLAG
jgi:carboxymethylenebutenolidase